MHGECKCYYLINTVFGNAFETLYLNDLFEYFLKFINCLRRAKLFKTK